MNPPRPRLLLVSPLPPPSGGVATWTVAVLGSPLVERFETRIVSTTASGAIHQKSKVRPDRLRDAARQLWALLRELARFRPDIVHVNTPYQWAFARDGLAIWIASLFGARTVLHLRGGDFPEFVAGTPAFVRWLIATTLRRTDRVIALTRATEEFLRTLLPAERVRYVPNFIRLDDVGRPPPREDRDDGPPEILFVGWILEGKGVLELLEAAQALPEARFTLVGPAQPTFAARIRPALDALGDRVRLLPPQPREQVIELYRSADIFALPTYREGFPNVVLEAMAAGLPVVATPVGAIPDAVRDGEEGILVAARDAEALTRALRELVSDRERRHLMGRRGRERAERLFAIDTVLHQLETIYLELGGSTPELAAASEGPPDDR